MSAKQEESVSNQDNQTNKSEQEQASFKAVLNKQDDRQSLKIFSATSEDSQDKPKAVSSFNPSQAPRASKAKKNEDWADADLGEEAAEEIDPILELSPVNTVERVKEPWGLRLLKWTASLLTALWLGASASYLFLDLGVDQIASMSLPQLGGMAGALLAPLVLLWVLVSSFARRMDVGFYAQSLKSELHSILFPTEERSARVHKDIEQLVEQSAQLAASSKAVLKSIHRARQGLRVEMRDFATLAKKGEHHMVTLSDQLTRKSSQVLGLVEEMEQRINAIDDHSNRGIESWDKASKTILERANTVRESMTEGTKGILDAASEATNKATVIQGGFDASAKGILDSVDRVSETLDSISGRFDEHVDRLMASADKVSEQSVNFANGLEEQLDEVDAVTNRAAEVLAKSKETLSHQRAGFDKAAQSIGEQTETTTRLLNDKVSELYMVSEHITTEFDGFEDRVLEISNTLSGSVEGLNGYLKKIEMTGNEAFGKLSEAVGTALSTSESMSATVRRSVDSIKQATKEAEDRTTRLIQVSGNEIKKIEAQEQNFLGQIKKFSDAVDGNISQLEEAQKASAAKVTELQTSTDETRKRFDTLVTALQNTLDGVNDNVSEPLERIETTLQDVEMAQDNLRESMEKRVQDLSDTAQKSVDTAKRIRDMLKGQAQDIASISGEISGHAQSIEESLLSQKQSFTDTVEAHIVLMDKAGQSLTDGQSKLSSASEKAQSDLLSVSGKLTTGYQSLRSQQEETSTQLEKLVDHIDDKTAEVSRLRHRAVQDLTALQVSLSETVEASEPLYQQVVDQTQEAHTSLVELSDKVDETFGATMERLRKTGATFEAQTETLATKANEVHGRLVNINGDLGRSQQAIEQAVEGAERLTSEMLQDFQDRAADIHLVADQANLKIDSVQKSLQEQLNTLSDYVGQAMARMATAEGGFVKASDKLSVHISKAEDNYARLRDSVVNEAETMTTLSEEAVKKTGDVVKSVRDESKNLLGSSEKTLSALKQIGDSISVRSMELEEQIRVSLNTSKSFAQELRDQSAEVANCAHDSVDKISVAISDLKRQADDVGHVSKTLNSEIGAAGQELKSHAKDLKGVSETAVMISSEASASFAEHTQSLRKASEEAAETVKQINEQSLRAQRDAFLSSSKFVIESLYSLSIDLVRHISGDEVQEKDRLAYERGDLTVFTKRLLAIGDKFPEAAVREKFGNDSEFRTYVQRYIRQFEEIYDQARDHDHGSILTATIGASDIGKVYGLLCKATGRTPRGVVRTANASKSAA